MNKRVALITGGIRGIGRAIALSLAEDGWSIAVCYRTSEKEGQETRKKIEEKGARALVVQCDVSDPKLASNFVSQIREKWGRIDALVNCAGPYHRVNILEETVEGWHSMFDNNLHPVFYLSRAVAEGMKEHKWGRIINFSMANADRQMAQPQLTGHYIAKVRGDWFARSLARVLAPHGITVNAISPGFINSGSAPEEELESMRKKIPAGYVGDTVDVVSVTRFLISEKAKYVNGANIHLSGGWGI